MCAPDIFSVAVSAMGADVLDVFQEESYPLFLLITRALSS